MAELIGLHYGSIRHPQTSSKLSFYLPTSWVV